MVIWFMSCLDGSLTVGMYPIRRSSKTEAEPINIAGSEKFEKYCSFPCFLGILRHI